MLNIMALLSVTFMSTAWGLVMFAKDSTIKIEHRVLATLLFLLPILTIILLLYT